MGLIDNLIEWGCLRTSRIIEAFRKVKRVDFLPRDLKDLAEADEALPIGWGQTISQPQVVAFMLEILQPQPGDKVLDIGAGSGWTTALLAEIVSSSPYKYCDRKKSQAEKIKERKRERQGKVIALELIPALAEFGRQNVSKYNFIEKGIVDFRCADGSKGCREEAFFDRILCSAAAKNIPQEWKEQLKVGGHLVSPVGSSVWLWQKKTDKDFGVTEYPNFAFVPLINNQ